jgi:hypothetical protein
MPLFDGRSTVAGLNTILVEMKALLQAPRRRPARRTGKASLPKLPVATRRLTLAEGV